MLPGSQQRWCWQHFKTTKKIKNKYNVKIENNLKNENDLKMETASKVKRNEDHLKNTAKWKVQQNV